MKKLFVVLNLLLSVTLLFAQNIQTIKGTVTDAKNETVPGVSVMIKGTMQGTITDIDGQYSVEAEPQAVLAFSFMGFQTQDRFPPPGGPEYPEQSSAPIRPGTVGCHCRLLCQ